MCPWCPDAVSVQVRWGAVHRLFVMVLGWGVGRKEGVDFGTIARQCMPGCYHHFSSLTHPLVFLFGPISNNGAVSNNIFTYFCD